THSLSYNFTITPKFRPGQQWCEVQGQVDGNTFLHSDCGNKNLESSGPLGKEINGTNAGKEQTETLSNVVEELRKELLDFHLENFTPSDFLPLQVPLSCQLEASGRTSGSWQFGSHGQVLLHFVAENATWILVHPGATQMKAKWQNDKDVTKFLRNTAVGDCGKLLTSFLDPLKKMQRLPAPPTEAPGTAQPKSAAKKFFSCFLPMLLTCSIPLAIL
ncbi:UL16-binding protein 3, partial [Daubentonia madagascariensis]